jgi:hypothetical protein
VIGTQVRGLVMGKNTVKDRSERYPKKWKTLPACGHHPSNIMILPVSTLPIRRTGSDKNWLKRQVAGCFTCKVISLV